MIMLHAVVTLLSFLTNTIRIIKCADIVLYASDGGQLTCATATASDTCSFFCDSLSNIANFDCGDASRCNIGCSETKCFTDVTITAQNTQQLFIDVSDGKECFRDAVINLPNYGDASFSTSSLSFNSYRRATIQAGSNTNNIYIDCSVGSSSSDNCRHIIINAASAQYLEINLGSNTLESGLSGYGIINCPANSNYNGPEIASCIINAPGGEIGSDIHITANNGIPNDLWIKGDPSFNQPVTITCAAVGYSDITLKWNERQTNVCWNTYAPTTNPTISTNYPTITPTTTTPTTTIPTTVSPTTSIPTTSIPTTAIPTTIMPTTRNPTTATPTNIPTITTMTPSNIPSTAQPSTIIPSVVPTAPIIASTVYINDQQIVMSTDTTKQNDHDAGMEHINSNAGAMDSKTIIILLLSVVVLALIIIIVGWFVCQKVKAKKQKQTGNVTNLNLTNINAVEAENDNDKRSGTTLIQNMELQKVLSVSDMDEEGMHDHGDIGNNENVTRGNDEDSFSEDSAQHMIGNGVTSKGNVELNHDNESDGEDMYGVVNIVVETKNMDGALPQTNDEIVENQDDDSDDMYINDDNIAANTVQ